MEERINSLIREEQETRKICENRLLESIEEKADIIKDEILWESDQWQQNLMKLVDIKEQDIPRITGGIKQMVLEREEMEQVLLNQTSDEFEKIRDLMREE